jgi:hypothetical protein
MAVDRVCCEPFSGSNSLVTGKNTGKFSNFEPKVPERNSVLGWIHVSYRALVAIDLCAEQGIIEAVSGNFLCDLKPYQGFSRCPKFL